MAATTDTTPPRTLEITRLQYNVIDKPLRGTAVGSMKAGSTATWTVREKLAVGDAVFIKLGFKKGE